MDSIFYSKLFINNMNQSYIDHNDTFSTLIWNSIPPLLGILPSFIEISSTNRLGKFQKSPNLPASFFLGGAWTMVRKLIWLTNPSGTVKIPNKSFSEVRNICTAKSPLKVNIWMISSFRESCGGLFWSTNCKHLFLLFVKTLLFYFLTILRPLPSSY